MRDKKYIIGVVFIGLLVLPGIFNFTKKAQLRQRMDDVKNLSSVYLQMAGDDSNRLSFDDLSAELKHRGIVLHNPIPLDPKKPCYEIFGPHSHKPQSFLVRETNTTDTDTVVLGLADGSVTVLEKSQLSKVVTP